LKLGSKFKLIVGVAAAGLIAMAGFWLASELRIIESGKREEITRCLAATSRYWH
jgi:hypothetical protein